MAQTGFTPISLYYTTTAAAVPTAGNLVAGELAINTQDGKLFYKDSAGVVQVIAGKGGSGVAGGSNTQVQYNSSGNLAGSANMTFSGTALTLANDASISGLTVGKGGGAVARNTTVGNGALAVNTTGTYLAAFGTNALSKNTTANANTAFGDYSLWQTTTASNNTAVGQYCLGGNTTGADNSALGTGTLQGNTTGSNNTAVGSGSLQANTTASNNTAVGYQAGYSTTTGGSNVSLGYQAGYSNSANSTNLYVGYSAGYSSTGSANTFVGGGGTTACGYYMTTGSKNTILGGYSGNQGGLDIRTASNYIVLSDGDGNPRFIVNNSGNVLIGTTSAFGSGRVSIPYSDSGYGIAMQSTTASATNYAIEFKNSSGSGVGYISASTTATTYSTSSDYRLKENVAPMTGALDKVTQLKPCTYTWKSNGSNGQGFIAHELQTVVPDCVTGKKDAIDAEGKPVYQGIDTSFLVATLVSAIQELKAEVDSLKQQLGK
jgi:hypothetical protein